MSRSLPTPVEPPRSTVSWRQARGWRLARHHLAERAAPKDLINVASELCGLHAQVMSSAELSLWARVEGFERSMLDDALGRRELVKLWAMRGTLHLLPASELDGWIAALATHTRDGNVWPEMDVFVDHVHRALAGPPLTRDELAREVEQTSGSSMYGEWVRVSWGSYLKAASYRGLLCFAAGEEGRPRLTTPSSWLGREIERLDPDAALRDVTRRYLASGIPGWRSGPAARRSVGNAAESRRLAEPPRAGAPVAGRRVGNRPNALGTAQRGRVRLAIVPSRCRCQVRTGKGTPYLTCGHGVHGIAPRRPRPSAGRGGAHRRVPQ